MESDEGMPTLKEGDKPTLEFPEGDAPKGLQISVLKEGKGEEITPESLLVVDYVGQVWGNEKPFDSSYEAGQPAGFPLSTLVPGWQYTLDGHHVGGEYIISVPAEFGYGPQGGNTQAGIEPDDTINFYVNVHDGWSSASAGEPDASVENPVDGLPVTLDGDIGAPVTSIKVKKGEKPPKEHDSTVIAKGSGDEVTGEGTVVYINFAASSWDGEKTQNTWTDGPERSGGAQQVALGSGTVFDALDGVPVGSRVLLTIPESDGGEEGVSSPAMVAVVDVLGFQTAPTPTPTPSS